MKAAKLPAIQLMTSPRPLVIAHRGYSQIAPENTLEAFTLGVAAGADLIELDCHSSKDGHLVVIHDGELDRTTDARLRWGGRHIKVPTRTASEIQSLDAGSWFDARYAGARVPLLREALETIHTGAVPLIERKAGEATAYLELLHQEGLINRVIVQSFDWQYLGHLHEQEPSQVLGALGPASRLVNGRRPLVFARRLSAKWLAEVQKTGARIVVWNRRVSKPAVQLAHHRGLKVWIYTVNNARLATRLLEMGVDGIITNNPSLIWKALALRTKGWEPAELVGRAEAPSHH